MNDDFAALDKAEKGSSLWRDGWRRLRRNKLAMAGMVVVAVVAAMSLAAPYLSSHAYADQNLDLGAVGPSLQHLCGTDTLGRDLFVRLLYGGRVSLGVGLCATLVSLTIGVAYGSISGYAGGRADMVMMRLVDALYAVPFTMLVIILMVMFGRNFILIFVAIGAIEWLTMARIARGQAMSLKHKEFIEAARAMGVPPWAIVWRHIVPNALGVIIVYATLTVPRVIMLEAFLSFLGLGVQAPMCSWGTLVGEGAMEMEQYPWMLFFPAMFFSATLFSLNFLGDGLRDAFDPKAAKN